jgi:hypothetical protein
MMMVQPHNWATITTNITSTFMGDKIGWPPCKTNFNTKRKQSSLISLRIGETSPYASASSHGRTNTWQSVSQKSLLKLLLLSKLHCITHYSERQNHKQIKSAFGRRRMQFCNSFRGMNREDLRKTKGGYSQSGPKHLNPLQLAFTTEISFPKYKIKNHRISPHIPEV